MRDHIGAHQCHPLSGQFAETADVAHLLGETKAREQAIAARGLDHAAVIHLGVDQNEGSERQQGGEQQRVDLRVRSAAPADDG